MVARPLEVNDSLRPFIFLISYSPLQEFCVDEIEMSDSIFRTSALSISNDTYKIHHNTENRVSLCCTTPLRIGSPLKVGRFIFKV